MWVRGSSCPYVYNLGSMHLGRKLSQQQEEANLVLLQSTATTFKTISEAAGGSVPARSAETAVKVARAKTAAKTEKVSFIVRQAGIDGGLREMQRQLLRRARVRDWMETAIEAYLDRRKYRGTSRQLPDKGLLWQRLGNVRSLLVLPRKFVRLTAVT